MDVVAHKCSPIVGLVVDSEALESIVKALHKRALCLWEACPDDSLVLLHLLFLGEYQEC